LSSWPLVLTPVSTPPCSSFSLKCHLLIFIKQKCHPKDVGEPPNTVSEHYLQRMIHRNLGHFGFWFLRDFSPATMVYKYM
jgi:hypothetical protein